MTAIQGLAAATPSWMLVDPESRRGPSQEKHSATASDKHETRNRRLKCFESDGLREDCNARGRRQLTSAQAVPRGHPSG
jgi:hypothetical protein